MWRRMLGVLGAEDPRAFPRSQFRIDSNASAKVVTSIPISIMFNFSGQSYTFQVSLSPTYCHVIATPHTRSRGRLSQVNITQQHYRECFFYNIHSRDAYPLPILLSQKLHVSLPSVVNISHMFRLRRAAHA
jgi:hypothetical protein